MSHSDARSKAPLMAAAVTAFRATFGDLKLTHVREGEFTYGNPTELTDVELVSIPGAMKGKKQLPSTQFTIVRAA